jgi:transposase InsO family protein
VFRDLKQARRALKEAVRLYTAVTGGNEERPHMAINYQTPAQKHAA